MTALLEARNVTKIFGSGMVNKTQTVALRNFSFTIDSERPSVTAIVGESGSGKTTLVRMLLGLAAPTSGEVLFRGTPITSLGKDEHRTYLREVQAIFQDPFEVFNPFYKVDHVLEAPLHNFKLATSRADQREQMERALSAVGLRPEETLGRYPHQLSGGQRQRIMVARAVLLRPRLIVADEPVSMVDASLRATILNSLLTLNKDLGISIVYITHDLTTAFQISEDIIVLYRGAVAEAGDVNLVVPDPVHPYTKLLVGSIPAPDPDEPWHGERVLGRQPGAAHLVPTGDSYCEFHTRCPYVMPMCVEHAPPLFRTDPARAATCYLVRDAPTIASEEMADVLALTRQGAAPEPVAAVR